MQPALLPFLACPDCRRELAERGGQLECAGGHRFPVHDGIPRFVPGENYAESFGLQWNHFDRTQLDVEGGTLSEERFFSQSRWPRALPGEVIVEAGAGAGRFTPHAASTGATVLSFDYSRAIDATRRNNAHLPNAHFLQGDIRKPPLRPGVADRLFCFGVLQHTPDPDESFRALVPLVKRGGHVAIDVYRRSWRSLLYGKYYLRPLTKRLPPRRLLPLVEAYVGALYPVTGLLHRTVGKRTLVLSWLLALADYRTVWDLPPERLRELAVLDTFDNLAPAHDHPRSEAQVRRWFADAGLVDVELDVHAGLVVARGRVP